MKRNLMLAVLAGAFSIGVLISPVSASDDPGSMARGGKLYDKWFKLIGAETPKATHKAWPASNTKKKGNVTWRCKSCHGWDGMGKDGAYAKGSYKTGIKGVNGMWGAPTAKIIAVMKDDTHGLAGKMDAQDYQDLALFVSKGMLDMKKVVNYKTKAPLSGNAGRGQGYFNTICAGCHRKDGSRPKDMDKTLGKQTGNPWEVMHKIQNGHPGEPMPALRAINGFEQIAMDLLAHLRTLPKKR